MAETSQAQASASAPGGDAGGDDDKRDERMLECNICLDTARDAVVSMCGHLFCWPCLHQWLETRPSRQVCPVCKAAISRDKVIPLYGRGNTKQEDPRNKQVPPRPAGQRTEPDNSGGFPGFGFGEGFHMSFGIGAFPFGVFTSTFNFGDPRPTADLSDWRQLCIWMSWRILGDRTPQFLRGLAQPRLAHLVPPTAESLMRLVERVTRVGRQRVSPLEDAPSEPPICNPSRKSRLKLVHTVASQIPICGAPRGTAQYDEEQFLSKIFLWVAILFVLWLIFA